MFVRIFALAKEFGLDPRDLIDVCHQLGIHVKSSALAKITDEERDRVRRHLAQGNGAGRRTPSDTASANPSAGLPAIPSTNRPDKQQVLRWKETIIDWCSDAGLHDLDVTVAVDRILVDMCVEKPMIVIGRKGKSMRGSR